MQGKKKLIIIISLVLIVVIIGAVRIITANNNKAKEVDSETLQAKKLSQIISVTGNIEAKDQEEIILSTQQKVEKIYVAEGQEVKAGTVLLTVDTTDLEYQLRKHKLGLDLANMNLNRLLETDSKSDKKTLENSVKQAEINLANATDSYNEAKRKFEQNKTLFESGAISKAEYDSSEKTMNDLKNQMELVEIQLNNARNSLADFDTNREEQIADQRNQIASAQADIANTQEKITKSSVRASINGKVVRLAVKESQYPTPDNSTVSIYDLSLYKAAVEISQYDAVSISLGQKAAIKIKGLDKEYAGTVSKIDETAAVKLEGTNKEVKVGVEITIDNPDDKIKAGYEADIDITLTESPDALAVNFEALQQEEDGRHFVFVVENDKAVKKYVKTGIETDFDVQITEGLKAGERYIKNPPAGLKENDLVKITETGAGI